MKKIYCPIFRVKLNYVEKLVHTKEKLIILEKIYLIKCFILNIIVFLILLKLCDIAQNIKNYDKRDNKLKRLNNSKIQKDNKF